MLNQDHPQYQIIIVNATNPLVVSLCVCERIMMTISFKGSAKKE